MTPTYSLDEQVTESGNEYLRVTSQHWSKIVSDGVTIIPVCSVLQQNHTPSLF